MVVLDEGEVAFIAARVRRLCETLGYPVPDTKNDEFVVRVSGSLIGRLLTDVEARNHRFLEESLEADQFLRCWREGDRAGCREFGFEADHAKEQSAEAGG